MQNAKCKRGEIGIPFSRTRHGGCRHLGCRLGRPFDCAQGKPHRPPPSHSWRGGVNLLATEEQQGGEDGLQRRACRLAARAFRPERSTVKVKRREARDQGRHFPFCLLPFAFCLFHFQRATNAEHHESRLPARAGRSAPARGAEADHFVAGRCPRSRSPRSACAAPTAISTSAAASAPTWWWIRSSSATSARVPSSRWARPSRSTDRAIP